MLGAFIWLFFILGGSVVLIRSWRVPLRIEVGEDAFILIDRHSGTEQTVPWDQVTRFRRDVLATEYVTRARFWLWVRAGSDEHRIEIETDCDDSARHRHFQELAAHISGLLARRGIRPDKRGE